MRNSIKRLSKHRHSSYSHADHDLDSVALQLVDISMTTDDNWVAIVPIKLSDEDLNDVDSLVFDTGLGLRPAIWPRQSEDFAWVEELKSEGRIQPLMDFPHAAAHQPGIDYPYDLNKVSNPAESVTTDVHRLEPDNATVVGEAPLSALATLATSPAHEQPVEPKVASLSASKWPQGDNARANPYLSRLLAFLIFALLACTGMLGYTMFEIKTELERLNGQLGQLTSRTGN